MSHEEEQQPKNDGAKRKAVDLTEEKEAKKPRVGDEAAGDMQLSGPIEPFDEDILNGDREASKALKAAAKKKTEQAEAWKKLFDEVSCLLFNRCFLIGVI